MLNKIRALVCYGTVSTGLLAWFLLIVGALVGLAGQDHEAEGIFTAAGYAANVFIPLLLGAVALTVSAPDR